MNHAPLGAPYGWNRLLASLQSANAGGNPRIEASNRSGLWAFFVHGESEPIWTTGMYLGSQEDRHDYRGEYRIAVGP